MMSDIDTFAVAAMPLAKEDLDCRFGRGGYEINMLAKLAFVMAEAMAAESERRKQFPGENGGNNQNHQN